MKEIKKEVTTEQVIYEISKEELESIKREERNKGRYDILGYIGFALKNYHCKLNLYGLSELVGDLVNFMSDKTNTIQNVYGYSFWDYMKKYR